MLNKDYHLDARYNYNNMLNDEEKRLYLFVVDLLLKQEYQFFYSFSKYTELPAGVSADTPVFTCDWDKDFIDLLKTMDSIHWDWPEIFYANRCEVLYEENGMVYIGGKNMPAYASEEIAELNAMLDEISHKFDHITDDFELELAVCDYITQSYDYDNDADNRTGRGFLEAFSVAGPLKTGVGVCGALTFMAQYILQQHNIPVVNIVAFDSEEDNYHSWLAVKIKGNYYHLDITFNETCTQDPEAPQYTHFNLTDDEIRIDHSFPSEEFPNIVCNSTEYNYYRHRGLYFENAENVKKALCAFIASLDLDESEVFYYYFRMPCDADNDKLSVMLKEVISASFARDYECYFCDGYYALILFKNKPEIKD